MVMIFYTTTCLLMTDLPSTTQLGLPAECPSKPCMPLISLILPILNIHLRHN